MMKLRYLLLMCLGLMFSLTLSVIQAQIDEEDNFVLTAAGLIDDENPFTEYRIVVPRDGSTIIADLRASDGNIRFDTLLYLVDENGQIIAENDDRIGGVPGDLTSRIEYPQALAGEYRVIATRYRVLDGTTVGNYIIDIAVRPPEEIAADYQVDEAALVAAGFPILPPRPQATFTVLAYYGGDNNLEQALINDLKEFERAGGSDENVRIVVLLDRSAEQSSASGDWSGARIFEVGPANPNDEPDTISSVELVDFGEVIDSGDGEIFAQFLTWGIQTFPADSYILAVGSHGVAWRGVVTDDTGDKTVISLPEISEALRVTRQATGLERFDLIVNEACYMGSVEYHNVIAEYFNYSLASPEVVLNPSHDMTLMTDRLRLLAQTGFDFSPDIVETVVEVEDATPDDALALPDEESDLVPVVVENPLFRLSADLADQYIDFDAQTNPGSDVVFTTSAVTDLREFNQVTDAISVLARYVQEDPINRGAAMWQARGNTYVYSGYKGRDELIDLGSLMRQLISVLDPVEDAEYVQYAQNVITALDSSVVYGRGGLVAERSVSSYHNIYFPSSSSAFDPYYFEAGFLAEWGAMLRALYSGVTPNPWDVGEVTFNFHAPTAPNLAIVNVFPKGEVSTLRPLNVAIEITGRNISTGSMVIDRINPDSTVERVFSGRLTTQARGPRGELLFQNIWTQGYEGKFLRWDARLPILTDGTNTNFERVILTEEVASLDGRYRPVDSDRWANVTLVFDRVTGVFNRAITQDAETNSAAVIEIPEGSVFQAFRYRVTSDGRQVAELGNEYTFYAEEIRWREVPAESGEYAIGLSLATYGGTQTTQTLNVTVNNDGVDENLLGFEQSFIGLFLAHPSDWLIPFFVGTLPARSIRTESIASDVNITVYPSLLRFDENDDVLQLTIDDMVALFDLNITSGLRPITLPDGTPSVEFDYTVRQNNALYIGRAFVSYLDKPFIRAPGLVVGAEVITGSEDLLEGAYDILLNSFLRYDPEIDQLSDTSSWQLVETLANIQHPMLSTGWELIQPTENDAWYSWENEEENAFFRVADFIANPSRPRAQIRDAFFDREVRSRRTNLEIIADDLTYTGAYATWSAVAYEADRDGVRMQGRFYLRLVNQRAYIIWFEAPSTPQGQQLTQSALEIMVDGFQIQEVPLEQLGVLPGVVNLGPANILAENDAEPELLLRYDARSIVMYNRLPNFGTSLNGLEFRQSDENGNLLYYVPISAFTVGDINNLRPQDCFQAWTDAYFEVPGDEFPADICNFRRSFLTTLNTFWLSDEPGKTFTVTQGGRVVATCLTVRPTDNYIPGNPDNTERQCLVDLPNE